ncbi:conserved hypothetical protein [Ricinus communis]|uniref:Uncharacterized protein n=1 Tax=Ricinus communis TaxID=3988 RepID=B9TM55_RICCO|nr:conserved hypothetical protein [Ricinus communis]
MADVLLRRHAIALPFIPRAQHARGERWALEVAIESPVRLTSDQWRFDCLAVRQPAHGQHMQARTARIDVAARAYPLDAVETAIAVADDLRFAHVRSSEARLCALMIATSFCAYCGSVA